jgi:hypothetical protein
MITKGIVMKTLTKAAGSVVLVSVLTVVPSLMLANGTTAPTFQNKSSVSEGPKIPDLPKICHHVAKSIYCKKGDSSTSHEKTDVRGSVAYTCHFTCKDGGVESSYVTAKAD